jgi:Fe-S cluster biogenesis protein NfuA
MEILEKRIEEALAVIRPYLQNDGGDVEFVSVNDGVVKIRWKGYCAICNKNTFTINGIAETIKELVPEVKEVIEFTE